MHEVVTEQPVRQRPADGSIRGRENGDRRAERGSTTLPPAAPDTLLRYFNRWKYVLLLVAAAITAVVVGNWYLSPKPSTATVSFLISGEEPITIQGQLQAPGGSPSTARLFHAATSTDMVDHLVERFDLYAHYDIDPKDPQHYEMAVDQTMGAINVHNIDLNCVAITVSDADPAQAAAMANEIFAELQRMAEQDAVTGLERLVSLYQEVISRSQEHATEQAAKLSTVMGEFKALANDPHLSPARSMTLRSLEFQLVDLVGRIADANEELLSLQKNYELSSVMLRKENLPRIRLVRKAVQELKESRVNAGLKLGAGTFSGTLVCSLLLLTLWFWHGAEFKSYFTEPRRARSGDEPMGHR